MTPESHTSAQVGRGRESGDQGLPATMAGEEMEGFLRLELVKASQVKSALHHTEA